MLKAKDKPCRTHIRTTENNKIGPPQSPLKVEEKSTPLGFAALATRGMQETSRRDVEKYDELLTCKPV